jgi:hypothetical protein
MGKNAEITSKNRIHLSFSPEYAAAIKTYAKTINLSITDAVEMTSRQGLTNMDRANVLAANTAAAFIQQEKLFQAQFERVAAIAHRASKQSAVAVALLKKIIDHKDGAGTADKIEAAAISKFLNTKD